MTPLTATGMQGGWTGRDRARRPEKTGQLAATGHSPGKIPEGLSSR